MADIRIHEKPRIGAESRKIILPGQQVNVRFKGILQANGQPYDRPESVHISGEKATLYKEHPWLIKSVPENAILNAEQAKIFSEKVSNVLKVIQGIEAASPEVNELLNDQKLKDMIARLKDSLDKNKGTTVRGAYLALAGIYGYIVFRTVGAVAVPGMPGLSPVETVLNTIAAAALFLGEGVIRIRTTEGFQHAILQALARGPEYYAVHNLEKARAAGMEFDPSKDDPFISHDALKCLPVVYIAREKDVLVRSLFGHFLVENERQEMVVLCSSSRSNIQKGYRENVDQVRSWIEDIRKGIMDAKNAGVRTESLRSQLLRVKAAYEKKAAEYLFKAQEDFDAVKQGSGDALDSYLAVQFSKHAEKWGEMIKAFDEKVSELEKDEVKLNRYLNRCYDYLEHKFTFDIILHFRTSNTVDMEAYNSILADTKTRLGGALSQKVTEGALPGILDAIRAEITKRRPDGAILKMADILTLGIFNNKYSAYILAAVKDGKTVERVLEELLMEEMARGPYRGGVKAGARSEVYSKIGKTFIQFESAYGTRYEFTKEEWQKQMSRAVFEGSAKARAQETSITNEIVQSYFTGVLNFEIKKEDEDRKDKVRKIVGKVKEKISDRNRVRMLERLEKSYINDGGNAKDLLREALIIAFYEKAIEWTVVSDADIVGSYDKDYVPLSIDPYTREYNDIFRVDAPMLKKWAIEHGRYNIAIIQNPQNQEHYLTEGPIGKDGERMTTGNGKRNEPVAKVSKADQQAWYGEFVLPMLLEGLLNRYLGRGLGVISKHFTGERNGENFLKAIVDRMYDKDADKKTLIDNVTKLMADRLKGQLDETTGRDIIECIKRLAKDKLISTGIGPGRGNFNSMFSCGTCELEYVPGMLLGYHRPYVIDMEGHVMAQAEIRYNPRTKKMEIFDYVQRYSGLDEGGVVMESLENQIKETFAINEGDISDIKAEYKNYRTEIRNNKVFIIGKKGNVLKAIWWYKSQDATETQRNDCRRVEVLYDKNESIKAVYDYAKGDIKAGSEYFKTVLGKGHTKKETVFCDADKIEAALSNLHAQREIVGEPVITDDTYVDGKGNVVPVKKITFEVRIPKLETTYVSAAGYREKVNTPPVFQPDKWITEDMCTTYYHLLTGWATEIHPEVVGSAIGPSDFVDIAKQHHRWFKGGPEVYLDFLKYIQANPELANSMQGYFMKHAYLWPAHTVTDLALYAVPAGFWVGLALPQSLTPLSTPALYIPMFAFYLWQTLGMYRRTMMEMGNGWNDIWMKEALLSMMGPVYVDAIKKGVLREHIPFAATDAGDRGLLSYEMLKGIEWRKDISKATMAFGLAYATGLTMMLGSAFPAPFTSHVGYMFNYGFPGLKWAMLESGVDNLYGYWTAMDAHIKDNLETLGARNIVISRKKSINFTLQEGAKVESIIAKLKSLSASAVEFEAKENGGAAQVKVEMVYDKLEGTNEKAVEVKVMEILAGDKAQGIKIEQSGFVVTFDARSKKNKSRIIKKIEGTEARWVAKKAIGAAKAVEEIKKNYKKANATKIADRLVNAAKKTGSGIKKVASWGKKGLIWGAMRLLVAAPYIARGLNKIPGSKMVGKGINMFMKNCMIIAVGSVTGAVALAKKLDNSARHSYKPVAAVYGWTKTGIYKGIIGLASLPVNLPIWAYRKGKKLIKGEKGIGKVKDITPKDSSKVRLEITKEGGMYSKYERAEWVRGSENFEHDMTVQGKEHKMLEELEKLTARASGWTLGTGRRLASVKRSLQYFKAIKAEKKSRTVNIGDVRIEAKLSKAEKSLLEKNIKVLKGIIADAADAGMMEDAIRVLADALVENGQPHYAAAMILKMCAHNINVRFEVFAEQEAKDEAEFRAEDMSMLQSKIAPTKNKGNLMPLLRSAVLKLPANAARLILALNETELEGIFSGIKDKGMPGTIKSMISIVSGLVPQDENIFMTNLRSALKDAKYAGIVKGLIKGMYGIEESDYDNLLRLAANIEKNEGNTTENLNAISEALKKVPKERMNAVLVRIVRLGLISKHRDLASVGGR